MCLNWECMCVHVLEINDCSEPTKFYQTTRKNKREKSHTSPHKASIYLLVTESALPSGKKNVIIKIKYQLFGRSATTWWSMEGMQRMENYSLRGKWNGFFFLIRASSGERIVQRGGKGSDVRYFWKRSFSSDEGKFCVKDYVCSHLDEIKTDLVCGLLWCYVTQASHAEMKLIHWNLHWIL